MGADINQQSDGGWITLHISAIYNNTDANRKLIQNGTSITTKSYRGEKPIDITPRMNSEKAVPLLQH